MQLKETDLIFVLSSLDKSAMTAMITLTRSVLFGYVIRSIFKIEICVWMHECVYICM